MPILSVLIACCAVSLLVGCSRGLEDGKNDVQRGFEWGSGLVDLPAVAFAPNHRDGDGLFVIAAVPAGTGTVRFWQDIRRVPRIGTHDAPLALFADKKCRVAEIAPVLKAYKAVFLAVLQKGDSGPFVSFESAKIVVARDEFRADTNTVLVAESMVTMNGTNLNTRDLNRKLYELSQIERQVLDLEVTSETTVQQLADVWDVLYRYLVRVRLIVPDEPTKRAKTHPSATTNHAAPATMTTQPDQG